MKKLNELTDADCLKAFDLNDRQGEGCSMIAAELGCRVNTADAAINRGRKLKEAQIKAEVLATMQANVDRIEAELAKNVSGFIHAWPKYGLGVRLVDGKSGVACVSLATVVDANDTRRFFNGADVPAVLTERNTALRDALAQTRASLAAIKAQFEKVDA